MPPNPAPPMGDVGDGLIETRRAVQALRGDVTRLDEQLTALAQTHRDRHSTAVELLIAGEPTTLPAESTVALIRTAQEALVNAAKHAPGQPVEVRLTYTEDRVLLEIKNGLPISGSANAKDVPVLVSVNGGCGLVGMRERLLLIKGSLDTQVDTDHWIVTAEVPR